MPFVSRALAFSLVIGLAACGGGGGGASTNALPTGGSSNGSNGSGGTSSSARQSVQLNMHIPGSASSSSSKRRPQFVAASTQGVGVTVYAHSDTTHANPLGFEDTNVAPGSPACGGASGARTCSVSIPAPPGYDDFVFMTYDQPPSSSTSFPPGANLLASGTVSNQDIVVASPNVVNVTLSGAIAYLETSPNQNSVVAGTGPYSYTFEVTAFDQANDVIIGQYADTNGNPDPVTVSEAEHGASGLTQISVDGGASGTTAQVNGSSDSVTVSYTGGGTFAEGYYATLQSTALSGQSLSSTFDPLFVSSPSSAFTAETNATTGASLNLTTVGQSATINFFEAGAPPPQVYNNCPPGVATLSAPGPTGTNQSFTITGSTAGGSCNINIIMGAPYSINVSAVGNTSATVAVPGTTLAYLSQGSGGVGIFAAPSTTPVGTIATATSADSIALDDSADVWVATSPPTGNTGPGKIALYKPGGSGYPPAYSLLSSATYTMTDPNHLIFIQASGAGELLAIEFNGTASTPVTTFDVWNPNHTGSPSYTIAEPGVNGSSIIFGGVDHNGDVVTAEYVTCGSNTCVQYSVFPPGSSAAGRTISESIVPQANQANFYPNYLAVGSDGTLYVTEWSFYNYDPYQGLYIYRPSGPEQVVTQNISGPNGVDLDGNGNIYVVNNNSVYNTGSASLDTAKNVSIYAPSGSLLGFIFMPVPNSYPITVANDGTAYISAFPNTSLSLTGGTYVASPNNHTPNLLSPTSAGVVVLWNDAQETLSKNRSKESLGSGTAHGGGFGIVRHR